MLKLGFYFCKIILSMIIINPSNLISTTASDENLQKLAEINNKFALKLLRELRSTDKSGNIFISPLSISTIFGMLCFGASGSTAEELQNVLGYEQAEMENGWIHDALKRLLNEELKESANFSLDAANAIIVDNTLGLLPEYKKEMLEMYSSDVKNVDFRNNSTYILKNINSWVKSKTNGKISHFLRTLDPNTVFFILNAVYFKGLWKNAFDPKKTYSETFFNNGKEYDAKSIPMMHMTRRLGTTKTSDCEVLELPYGQDNIVMLIMLPKNGLKTLELKLNHETIVKIQQEMKYRKLHVSVPKFKMQFSKSLMPELKKIGLKKVFENPDFSGIIANMSVPVSDFYHKSVIEVNEEGTEAAAVSSSIVKKSRIESFDVNRPFFFAIIDERISFVLFLGYVSNL